MRARGGEGGESRKGGTGKKRSGEFGERIENENALAPGADMGIMWAWQTILLKSFWLHRLLCCRKRAGLNSVWRKLIAH